MDSAINFVRKMNFGLQAVAKEFRSIASFFFRLSLVLLFTWYSYESAKTLFHMAHYVLASTFIIVTFLLLLTFVGIVYVRYREFDAATPEEKEEKSSFLPFLLLNLPFVAAVELGDLWCSHRFEGGLLGMTQDLLRWIVRRFS